MLQSIGAYRKTQPKNDSEVEFIENACTTLSSCITFSVPNLEAFLDGQGIELALRCLKERVHAGVSCLKLLDFFGSDQIHKRACERLVNAGVFKYLFPIFLNSRIPKPAPSQAKTPKTKREWLQNIETQTIRILYALSHHLDDDSPDDAKARFLTKFVEDDRKCDRLVELLLSYDQKARKAEYNFYRSDVEEVVEKEETVQLAALEAKLKGGGDLFHRLGAIASFVCMHSKRCHERILSQLQLRQSGIGLVRTAVDEFVSVLGDAKQKEMLRSYLENL
jgi:beta-catenin-like protein 1